MGAPRIHCEKTTMIATLTPNPCIDKTVAVSNFDIYKMNRVRILRSDVSGKGINVSLALRGLEYATAAIGFDFCDGNPSSTLKTAMEEQGIPSKFVDVPGQLRLCTKIFDESLKHTIEINEYGTPVSPENGEKLIALAAETAKNANFLTLSGSLPKGLESDFYSRCICEVKKTAPDCKIVVDAEKELLVKALEQHPFLIKPNIHEFRATFNCDVNNETELDNAARNILQKYGLGMICVSLGADGAYMTDGNESYVCNAVKVEVRSIQGAGDSMVAGICAAVQDGLPLPEVLRYAVTASGASISLEGTQLCTREIFLPLLSQNIGIRKIG